MAHASANIHLSEADAPVVTTLPDSGSVALWLTGLHKGPSILGSREQLIEVRRAIGRFLFPEEFEQPDTVTPALVKALKPFADLGVGSGPDEEHDTASYRLTRGSIRKARAALALCEGNDRGRALSAGPALLEAAKPIADEISLYPASAGEDDDETVAVRLGDIRALAAAIATAEAA